MTQRSALFASIEDAVAAIGRGEMVVVVDDEDRENEGDLIMAAEYATPERSRSCSATRRGVICVPIDAASDCDELDLPLMVQHNTERHAHRVHRLGRLPARHHDGHLRRRPRRRRSRPHRARDAGPTTSLGPGHIFPLRYREGGVLKRAGHTEAAVDLARLAGPATRPACCARS